MSPRDTRTCSLLADGDKKLRRSSKEPKIEIPFAPPGAEAVAQSLLEAVLARPCLPLPPPSSFTGPGIYALYYTGDFEAYALLAHQNRDNRFRLPIYVGQKMPSGARQGKLGFEKIHGHYLYDRLHQHANSINATTNLTIGDFRCRYLVVDPAYITLGEQILIRQYQPIWNTVVDGFGIHAPGERRPQQRSRWDTIHPGRHFAANRPANRKTPKQILEEVKNFLRARLEK